MTTMENKFDKHQCALLSSIANAKGFQLRQDDDVTILENADFSSSDHNVIAKNLLGLTATVDDLASTDAIINYIKKLPNYDKLIAEAREYLESEGITIPRSGVIETFQPGTIGWMRQLIDICK